MQRKSEDYLQMERNENLTQRKEIKKKTGAINVNVFTIQC